MDINDRIAHHCINKEALYTNNFNKMDGQEDTAVQDFLEILEEHRKNCERQGKYVEAEIAKNRLDELKLHEENRRRVSFLRLSFRFSLSY